MSAFKKLEGRYLYLDMSTIHVPSWKIREIQKLALEKHRRLKKIDPFARCMGKPLKYGTPQMLKSACDDYFKTQECYIYDKYGNPIKDLATGEYLKGTQPLTISGLALHLGIQSETLRRYKAISESGTIPREYADIINEALSKIEAYAERRSYDKDGQRGAQFILQAAFRWKTPKEKSDIQSLKVKDRIALEKLQMEKEEHELKMQLLRDSLNGDVDGDVNITITRASRKEQQ